PLIPPPAHLFPYTTLFRSLAPQVRDGPDGRLDHEGCSTARGAGDDPDRLSVGLGVRVDRRVRADVRGVDGVGEHRLGRRRSRVEDRKSTRLNSSHRTISYA